MIKTFKVVSLIGSIFLTIGCSNPTSFHEGSSKKPRRLAMQHDIQASAADEKGEENGHAHQEESSCGEQQKKLGLCIDNNGSQVKRIKDRGFPVVTPVPVLKPVAKKPKAKKPKQVAKKPQCPCETKPKPQKEKPYIGKTKVDFIVVVDSSYSMSRFLRDVRPRFANFIRELNHLDWRMIFTNADHGGNMFLFNGHAQYGNAMPLEFDGESLSGVYFLEKDNLGPKQYAEVIFIDTIGKHVSPNAWRRRRDHGSVQRRTSNSCRLSPGCGGGNEEPLKALQSAIKVNKHLFRPDAHLSALIISDSEEGRRTDGAERVHVKEVLQTFENELSGKFPLKAFMTYGIIMLPNDKQCQIEFGKKGLFADENVYSYQIAEMAEWTKGFNVSICDDNYASLAKRIVSDFKKLEVRRRIAKRKKAKALEAQHRK